MTTHLRNAIALYVKNVSSKEETNIRLTNQVHIKGE